MRSGGAAAGSGEGNPTMTEHADDQKVAAPTNP